MNSRATLRAPLQWTLLYLARMELARTVLWCYFLWYLVILVTAFDPNPRIWLTSLGLSLIIGVALLLNAGWGRVGAPTMSGWQRFRFFLMPFCVSSFSALVKGRGFVLIFSPVPAEVMTGIGVCAGFLLLRRFAQQVVKSVARRA